MRRPDGYKTKRGQFYGSLTAMPAHERDSAQPVWAAPEDQAHFEVRTRSGALLAVADGNRAEALAQAREKARSFTAEAGVQLFEVFRVPVSLT